MVLTGGVVTGGIARRISSIDGSTPEAPLALYSALRFLKYALVPIYIIHFAPAAFQRLRI